MKLSKERRIVIFIILSLVGAGLATAYIYYSNLNKSEDPRIIKARAFLMRYDGLMKRGRFMDALPILDSTDAVYDNTSGYNGAFEYGVIYNNRASVYIMMALYDTLISEAEKQLYLKQALSNVIKSIDVYTHWMDSVGVMTEDEISNNLIDVYVPEDSAFDGYLTKNILEKRVKDLLFAQVETKRRMSAALTNKGTILRHMQQLDEALQCYVEAIEMWKDNYQAKDNLNVLLGKNPKGRNVIQKMFPPERKRE